MSDLASRFITESRNFLAEDYLPKIGLAVARLDDDDLWWRPNPASNSIGNLLLHLSGNLRQWVVAGLGGEPDTRQRELEFDPIDRPDRTVLLAVVSRAVADADAVLAALNPGDLADLRTIQGREVTGLHALYHAVEHFGMHTGQILYIAKLRAGEGLGLYEIIEGIPRERWRK